MSDDSETTGTSDSTYAVVSVLYHALQGAETYEMYADDADADGEEELGAFFRELVADEKKRAEKAKRLLAGRLGEESDSA